MKPRPFYRWKSFWLGLCVLVFLGWAWFQSIQRISIVSWTADNEIRQVLISQWDAALHLWRGDNGFAREPGFSFETRLFGVDERAGWFPRAFTWNSDRDGAGFIVAHWFLILLFLVPWSAWLFYHWKREQKKTNA